MGEFESLVVSINQSIDLLRQDLEKTQRGLDQVVNNLSKIPEKYVAVDEARAKVRKLMVWLIGMLVAGLMVAGTVGVTLVVSHRNACSTHGILVLAKTAAARNPIPDTLSPQERANVEAQRAQAAEFYDQALHKLHILWSCSEERQP